jgi:hypothetical protein
MTALRIIALGQAALIAVFGMWLVTGMAVDNARLAQQISDFQHVFDRQAQDIIAEIQTAQTMEKAR